MNFHHFLILLLTAFGVFGVSDGFVASQQGGRSSGSMFLRVGKVTTRMAVEPNEVPSEVDVVVIGSGLAGLSCAALLSHCDKSTVVLESHDTVGGATHSWERRGFHFESGPSLYSGFSQDRSPNPLKNIFVSLRIDALPIFTRQCSLSLFALFF